MAFRCYSYSSWYRSAIFVSPLQTFTADFSVRLLRLSNAGISDGNLIQVPGAAFVVAEACAAGASYRQRCRRNAIQLPFLYQVGEVFYLYGIIANHCSRYRKRIASFGIIYLAYLTDNRSGAGADHIIYGWGFFVRDVALLAIGCVFADRRVGRIAACAGGGAPLRIFMAGITALAPQSCGIRCFDGVGCPRLCLVRDAGAHCSRRRETYPC